MMNKIILGYETLLQNTKPNPETGCLLWQGSLKSHGYGRVSYQGKKLLAHRISWVLYYKEEISKGLLVLHKCDTPGCINPDHLYLGTQKDNARDRDQRGRAASKRGELNGQAKLTWRQVKEIRGLKGKEIAIILAEKFKVHPWTIHKIWQKRSWKVK